MQIQITGKKMDLSDAIKDYVTEKMSSLNKFYNEKIIRADVVVGINSDHHQKGDKFFAECKLDVPGKNLFALKEEDSLYKAVDKIRDFLELELKKYKMMQRVKSKDKKTTRGTKEYQIEL